MTLKEMHHQDEAKRILLAGKADHAHTDNSVSTAKYTLLTFLPIVSIISNTSCVAYAMHPMHLCVCDGAHQ
jgi:hypothetical protein